MLNTRGVIRNASMAIVQVIVTTLVLFIVYRYLLETIGVEQVGVWAIVLATTSASRISELGLAGGAIKFVAAANAIGEIKKASYIVQTASLTIAGILAFVLITGFPIIGWILKLIIPEDSLVYADTILPYALISVWMGGVGGVIHLSLDGCQRADLRSAITMLAGVIYAFLVWILAPGYGLIGLGIAQISQSIIIFIISWILLRRQIPAMPLIPSQWRFSVFSEMFHYGLNFQVITIFRILYEPLTKAFVTKFGGLSAAAYFEMANRMVLQLRALIVAANQVLVPKVAEYQETDPGKLREFYMASYGVVVFVSVPFYALLVTAVPLISQIWIGHKESEFIFYSIAISLGYLVNTLAAPAYFMNLGTGYLRWNVLSHIVLGIATCLLGYLLGKRYGAYGAVMGSITSLIIASIIIILGYHKNHNISLRFLIPNDSRLLFVTSFLGAVIGWIVLHLAVENGYSWVIASSFGLLIASIVVVNFIWLHPLRSSLQYRLINELRKQN